MNTSTEVELDRRFFGHPRGLANLFGVEMWERFSFYGMLGILALYLYHPVAENDLGMEKATAGSIVGAYGGLVYLSAIIGAWVADRLLGAERTLFFSAVLIMIGHISLAVLPGYIGLTAGLACVAIGSGGLKANATTIVGTLYSPEDERRDGGFTIFYMGVNLGAWIGQLITGWVADEWGYHPGFALAAIGMAAGLIQYTMGRKNLGTQASVIPNPLPANRLFLVPVGTLVLAAVIVAAVLFGLVTAQNLADVTVLIVLASSVIYFAVILSSKHITSDERSRVFSFIPMFIASSVFFALYQQQFTVITIYIDERLDRTLFGWEMPVPWVNSVNPVFIIVFASVIAAIWTKLGPRQPSSVIKFAMGTVLVGLGFLLFLTVAGGGKNSTPLLFMIAVLFVITIAELLLSPVGLSLPTKLAPKVFRGQMVALNFLSISLGTAFSGKLTGLYSVEYESAYFGGVGAVAIAVGLLLAALSPIIRKMMKGVH